MHRACEVKASFLENTGSATTHVFTSHSLNSDFNIILTKSSVQVARNHLRYSNSSVTIFCTSGWVQNPPARKMCFAFAMIRESYAVMATWWQNVYTRVRAMSSRLKSAEMNSKEKNESVYLFIFSFWRTSVIFVGPLLWLLLTSGDACPVFQSQDGSLTCMLRGL